METDSNTEGQEINKSSADDVHIEQAQWLQETIDNMHHVITSCQVLQRRPEQVPSSNLQ